MKNDLLSCKLCYIMPTDMNCTRQDFPMLSAVFRVFWSGGFLRKIKNFLSLFPPNPFSPSGLGESAQPDKKLNNRV